MTVEVVGETLLILQESPRDPLLELVDVVPRWMSSGPDLLQGFRFVNLRLVERIRGKIQVKLSFQIDGFGTDPLQL